MRSAGLRPGELADIVAEMQATGEEMAQRRLQSGREPTSATFTLGRDLTNWVASDNARYVRRATMEEGGMIEAYCLDPKGALSFFHEVHGSIHMSGTLRPLDQYVRVTSLGENTKTAIFESPFPKENRKVLFVEDVEAKYESRSDPERGPEAARLCYRSGERRLPQHHGVLPVPCHAAQLPVPEREAVDQEGLPGGAGGIAGEAGRRHRKVQARFP